MPKISIPKFKGGLVAWHAFWGRFSASVHNNHKIPEYRKLAHLSDMIIDPALEKYMVTAMDGEPGRYKDAIAYLTNRFNRPRELHSIHCRALAEMQPIKGTPAELSAAADSVHAALRRSGQDSIEAIATSLVAPILPDHLRSLWENKTEENPKVPKIDQWIEFIRNKATMVDKSQKSATISVSSTYSRPPKVYWNYFLELIGCKFFLSSMFHILGGRTEKSVLFMQ